MKKKCRLIFLAAFMFFNFLFALDKIEDFQNIQYNHSLRINLVGYRNGVGLDQDIDILINELTKLGHVVDTVDYRNHNPRPKADINIFIEVINEHLLQYANENYLLPNPEWYTAPGHTILHFNKILCKTREAERIFKEINPNTVFMSFTCQDRYDPLITKNFRSPLHLAGGSIQKSTNEVFLAWQQNPHLPKLTLIKHRGGWSYPHIENLHLVYHYLCLAEIIYNQNYHGLHICPSTTEGFGHYIMEGLGCGAVVVTTNAPPMNEFVKDERCLVPYYHTAPHYLGINYHIQPEALANVVENLLSLPEEELQEIGRKNREYFLQNELFFKKRLAEIFPAATKEIN